MTREEYIKFQRIQAKRFLERFRSYLTREEAVSSEWQNRLGGYTAAFYFLGVFQPMENAAICKWWDSEKPGDFPVKM